MKRNQLLMLCLVAIGLQGVSAGTAVAQLTARGEIVQTSPFPADGEGPFNLPAIESAERHARLGGVSEAWGVSRREVAPHDPYPFGGGPVDD